MAKVHPSWKKSGNSFEQPYGFQEQLYSKIAVPPGERGLFLIGTYVSFKYTGTLRDLIPVFQKAWIQMRHQFPALAALTTEKGKIYHSPNQYELEEWAKETFKVQRQKNGAELFRDLTKTTYATLHYLPEFNELFLQSEHHHLDGRGVMHFWDEFFEAILRPKDVVFGIEFERLPPRSDDLLALNEKVVGRGKDLAASLLQPLSSGEPISMPVANINASPSRNFSLELKFSVRDTTAIIQACKKRNFTLTAVWHAAMALATQEIQKSAGGSPGTKFMGFSNFNLRGYFPKSNDTHAYTVSNHHTVLPVVVEPDGKSFDEIASQLTKFYRTGLSQPADIWCALKPMIEEVTPLFTSGDMTDTTPAVSSLGNIEPYIKRKYGSDWEIEDVWFGDTVTGPWIEGFLWAWRNRLVLCSCYNSGFYTPRDVEAFQEKVAQVMMENLGLYDPQSRL
ncbi:hypothetical protein F4819DRAFT_510194 [Hypoxylon fuscum]|nr:hypothetical protein F4819DRAFT_510194 [Hypoxylon fuscum]